LKPERWGSPLVREKYRAEKACDKRHPYRIIIIIIIITIIIMLIHVAISGGRNVIKKEAEKILKYKDLTIEIQGMWNVKPKVIPVILRATGTISKSFRKYVSNIPGKHEVNELPKTPILCTAYVIRKVLM